MRILHAYPEFISKGGRPHDCRQLVSHLSRLGEEVCAVGVERPEKNGRIYPDKDVRVEILKPSALSGKAFRDILIDFKPDIVHFTGGPRIPLQNSWASQVRKLRIPYAVSGCGNLSRPTYYHRWGNKKNYFFHPWLKKLYFTAFDGPLIKGASFVHASSDNEAQIAHSFGASATEVIPFGMDDDWVRKDSRDISPAARPLVFTYLGRLSIVHKGLDLIVDAFGELARRGLGDQVELILAGTSENGSMEVLKTRAREQGVEASFPGGVWHDEKEALWNRTHFFLHMCRFNGFALATREALGQGVPIIATMESDFGDWVEKFGMGSVVELSAISLADEIESLLTKTDLYDSMVDGVRRYCSDTSWTRVALRLQDAYSRTLAANLTSTTSNTDSPVSLSA